MPYTYKYDYRTETAFIGYTEDEKEIQKCRLCLEELKEGEGEDDCICEWCKENKEEN